MTITGRYGATPSSNPAAARVERQGKVNMRVWLIERRENSRSSQRHAVWWPIPTEVYLSKTVARLAMRNFQEDLPMCHYRVSAYERQEG